MSGPQALACFKSRLLCFWWARQLGVGNSTVKLIPGGDKLCQKCYIMAEVPGSKQIVWVASTKKDLKEMPEDIQDEVGYALEQVQRGETPDNAEPLHGNLSGVFEIKADDDDGATYRTMYTTKIGDVVYALDAFKKKSKRGIATPKADLERIEQRLKWAKENHARQQ